MQMAKAATIIHSNHPFLMIIHHHVVSFCAQQFRSDQCNTNISLSLSQCTSGLVPVVRAQSGDVFPVLSVNPAQNSSFGPPARPPKRKKTLMTRDGTRTAGEQDFGRRRRGERIEAEFIEHQHRQTKKNYQTAFWQQKERPPAVSLYPTTTRTSDTQTQTSSQDTQPAGCHTS